MTAPTHYTLRELLDAGVPRDELIDAIARGQLGPVIAGGSNDSTPVGRAAFHRWLNQRDDQNSSQALRVRLTKHT